MTCCSACSDDSSFVVPIAFGNALWLWACVCVSGGHFECRNEREFWNCVAGGRAVRKAGVGQRERAGHMNSICPEVMGSGILSFLC